MKLKKLWKYVSDNEKVVIKLLLEEDAFGFIEECTKADKDPSCVALDAEVRQICTRDGVLYIEVEKL